MGAVSEPLIQWFELNRRLLPFRQEPSAYHIWVSEIMLQQTRVSAALPYYERFLAALPDIPALAACEEEKLHKLWEGLGYYSRARNLHAAAKSMKGTFPKTYAEVRALKGVGDYTAAAICSFAYDMPYAAVDGNVYRVLSRYFGIDVPIDSTEGKKTFTALAGEVLDKSRPADYNQAIMDFGAVQCTPQSPNCLFCPLSGSCRALSEGKVQQLPVKQHRTKTTNRYFNYIYVRMGAHTLIHKRTEDDIWKNLFELPLVETEKDLSEEEFLACPQFHALFAEGEVRMVRILLRGVKHVLSHRVIYTNFYEVTLPDNSSSFSSYQRVAVEDLGRYAVPRLIHAFLEKYV